MYQTTLQHYENHLKELYPKEDFTVLSFTNTHSKVTIQCNKCKNILDFKSGTTLYKKRRTNLCTLCGTKSVQSLYNKCEQCRFTVIKGDKKVTGKWLIKCLDCGNSFYRVPSEWKTAICPFCGDKDLNKIKDKRLVLQERIDKVFGCNQYILLETNENFNSIDKLAIKHLKCGHIQNMRLDSFLKSTGCQKCSSRISKGERKIIEYLEKHNIEYAYQVAIENTRQRFDFKIGNIVIEYNGEQHYKAIEVFGGETRYEKQKILDDNKYKYCKENNLQLYIIKYIDYKNIDTILNSIFGSTTSESVKEN